MNNLLHKKYYKVVNTLDIPDSRKPVTESNLKWFLRNGAITNMSNANCQEAIYLAKQILRGNF